MTTPTLFGRGLASPFHFDRRGRTAMSGGPTDDDAVQRMGEALQMLYRTPVGSRLILRGYGSPVARLIHRVNDVAILRPLLEDAFVETADRWEPRARVTVRVDDSEREQARAGVAVSFLLIERQVEGNVVIPFALDAAGRLVLPDFGRLAHA